MFLRLKKIVFNKGFAFSLFLSIACLCFFFGNLLRNPNKTYFSVQGDGLQSYYVAIYHVKHDANYWHFDGLNYPYGEQVFYTGCQPFLTNTIKVVSTIFDISDYTVGIINVFLLFSIILSSITLYLIFKHLHLPDYYSGIAGCAIAFLSPQIIRIGGHFSLAYQFAIPLLILLLLKFYKAPSNRKSILIGLLTFFMAGTHMYFFVFFAILLCFYWASLYVSREPVFGKTTFAARHLFIQLIAPYVLLQILIFFIDKVKDRTSFPWGYLDFASNLTGVFYPTKRFYTPLFSSIIEPKFPLWEGYGFIGIIATIVFVCILLIMVKKIIQLNYLQVLKVTDSLVLNGLFLGSLFALVLSLGYPFSIRGCEDWLSNSGPIKQLRGIGRFVWLFYYVINIIAFYKLYQWASRKSYLVKRFFIGVVLFFVSYDAYIMSSQMLDNLNNKIVELDDTENKLPQNRWLNELNLNDYQAIIPLPYFHIGSENVWISPESEIYSDVFIASLKSGLPTTSLILSRVSLSQTYKNIQLVKGPYRPLEIVSDFKNDKPFLVIAKEDELNEQEKQLLRKCKKRINSTNYNLYELNVETLKHISDSLYAEANHEFKNSKTFLFGNINSTDSIKSFYYEGFEKNENKNCFVGKGCFEGKMKEHYTLFCCEIPNVNAGDFVLSFWVGDFKQDIYPRAFVEISLMDSTGIGYGYIGFSLGKNVSVMNGDWALIEQSFELKHKSDRVNVTIWNKDITDESKLLHIDELLIRPTETRIFKDVLKDRITMNNRTYFSK